MTISTPSRKFVVPLVRELADAGAGRAVPPERQRSRPSQRSLVAASLIACPGREARFGRGD